MRFFIAGASPQVRRMLFTHGVRPPHVRYKATVRKALKQIQSERRRGSGLQLRRLIGRRPGGRQRTAGCVEQCRRAVRERQPVVTMADRQAAQDRHAEPFKMIAQQVHDREAARKRLEAGELADGDAGDAVEMSRLAPHQ